MAMNTVFLHLSEEAIKRLNKLRGWRKVSRSAILREAVVLIHLKYEKNREDIGLFGIWRD